MSESLSILVVDDDECDRLAMRRALAKAAPGAEIYDAGGREPGLALLQKRRFDCGFIDYRLPDGDGLSLLVAARARAIATPLVMLTGFGDETLAVEALRCGAADYLPKASLTGDRLSQCLASLARGPFRCRDGLGTASPEWLERAVANAAEALVVTDPNGRIDYVNAAFTRLTGYSPGEVVGRPVSLLKSHRTPPARYQDLWAAVTAGQVWRGELTNRRRDGALVETALAVSPVFGADRRVEGFIASLRDISAEKRLAGELERLANTDGLTGVFNRRFLVGRLGEAVARAKRYHRQFCLMLIDLDHFKQVNDSHGHLKGDEVLQQSAQMIRQTVRLADMLARYGGEEFCVLLPETELDKARLLAERIRRRLEAHHYRDGRGEPFRVTCSIGLAGWREGMDRPETLLQAADEALYQAKAAGRNRVQIA